MANQEKKLYMKKIFVLLVVGFCLCLTGCGMDFIKITRDDESCEHDMIETSRIEPTCIANGTVFLECSTCGETSTESLVALGHKVKEESRVEPTCESVGTLISKCERCDKETTETLLELGHDMKEVSRVEPMGDADGTITHRCSRCPKETTEVIVNLHKKGSKENPYVLNANEWYKNHCEGTSPKYINQYVKVTGMVLNISDYNALKGYYLVGGASCGLVCWVDNGTTKIECGQLVEYLGKVTVEDEGHIEIAECEVLSVTWSIEKLKSPVTISDWSWSRDSVGGVEWNFRLTNNTDKVIKYVTIKWNCYNAVGDLVYDNITGDYSKALKYTGPLYPRETTDYLCNPTLFYSYSYKSSKFTYLQVEFMDGTIIRITDKAYTDIIVSKLEAETVFDSNGVKYIVNNNLNTAYVADIGTCTNTYIGILSSLYSDTVTHIGEYAFVDASFIETVSITKTLKGIGEGAFMNCTSLTKIRFSGKIEDWYLIEKGENWDYNTGEYIIECYDGQILKDGTIIYD